MGWFKSVGRAVGKLANPTKVLDAFKDPVNYWKEDVWQPTKDIWNATGQPVYSAVSDSANQVVNKAAQWTHDTNLPGSHTIAKGMQAAAPPSASEIEEGKPMMTFANRFDTAAQTLPEQIEPYAQTIATTALSFVPGVGWILAPAFNTALNAGRQQQAKEAGLQGGFKWGEFAKDAAVNFGSSYAAKLGGDWLKGAKEAQAAKSASNIVGSGSAPATSNFLSVAGEATPQTTSNIGVGAGSLVQGVPSTMSSFSVAPSSVSAAADVNRAAGAAGGTESPTKEASTTSLEKPSVLDQAYNEAVKPTTTGSLANKALTSTLAPKMNSALSGTEDSSLGALSGDVYQPTGSDIFNAFGGDAVGNQNQITDDQYLKMVDALKSNAGAQASMTRDTMLPAGQTEPEPNTPYAKQLQNIGGSMGQGVIDLGNQVNAENYARYNDALYNQLNVANDNRLTPDMFQTWLNDPTTRPQNLMSLFITPPSMYAL